MRPRRVITIDIETLPASEPLEILLTEREKNDERKLQEAHRKTALNGDFGRVLCIGYCDEKANGERRMGFFGWDKENKCLHADERTILKQFWSLLKDFDPNRDRLVGHNIFDFDLRFIIKRSIVNRVRPTVECNFARYRSQPIFDTMCEWECWNFSSRISLEKLAFALSLPTSKSEEVNGSQIYDLYQAQRHREIREYCLRDVRLTRQIYKLMTFTTEEDMTSPKQKLTALAAVKVEGVH